MILINLLMKMNYKKLVVFLFSFLILTIIAVPILTQGKNEENKGKGFCVRISSIVSKIDQRIDHYTNKLTEKRTQNQNRVSERRQERSNRFEEKREKWDVNRAEHFEKLEERAQTNEQKQAIIEFKKIITQAISNRRAKIDIVIQNFRNGLSDLKTSRKTSIDNVILDYKNDIKTALNNAESACQTGTEPGIINKDLRDKLKQIKDDFVTARKNIERMKSDTQLLILNKKEAIKQAIDEFKITMNQAVEDLKAEFPEIDEDSEEEENEEEENEEE